MGNLKEIKKGTLKIAEQSLDKMMEQGELDLPPDYSPGNALKSAWLKLQETKDRKGNSVLTTCSRISIVNAMLDTVIQGLSPAKDQVYYIAYGKTLIAQTSYFGNITLARRFAGVESVNATAIYEGDEVEISMTNGNRQVTEHKTAFGNIDDDKVVGVYAVATFTDGRSPRHEIMTLKECKKAWKMGNAYGKSSTHDDFTAEMAKKTVINRLLKPLIKGSTDSYVLAKAFDRSSDVRTAQEVSHQIEGNLATEDIEIEELEDIEGNYTEEEPEDNEPEDELEEEMARAAANIEDEDNPF